MRALTEWRGRIRWLVPHFALCLGRDVRIAMVSSWNVTVIIWPCLSSSSPSDKSESILCYINKPHYVIDTTVSVISCRRPDGLRCRFYISEIRNHLGVASRRDVTSRFSLSGMKYATVGPYAGGETKLISQPLLPSAFSGTFRRLSKFVNCK